MASICCVSVDVQVTLTPIQIRISGFSTSWKTADSANPRFWPSTPCLDTTPKILTEAGSLGWG